MAFTYFFRDLHTLKHFVHHFTLSTAGRSSVRIWDAGCASGQEPYTLAILLAEAMGHFSFRNLKIEATDIDGSNLFGEIIAKGIYPWDQLERIPPEILRKYFNKLEDNSSFQLDQQIRDRLHFQKQDLLLLSPIGCEFSAVICKNVLLHFQMEERIKVIKMFHSALLSGGYLVMEQTQGRPESLSHLFEQVTEDAQLFRKV